VGQIKWKTTQQGVSQRVSHHQPPNAATPIISPEGMWWSRHHSINDSGRCQTGRMTGDDGIPELTEAERIKLRTARAAADAMLRDPDPDSREAAFEQFRQTGRVYSETRDSLHVPDDAGQYADQLRTILRRIPTGWGRWISCDAGWYPLICELDSQLAQLDPEYEVHQVKEKFGTLRYYARSDHYRGLHNPFSDTTRDAERRSAGVCELCGAPGGLCETAPMGEPWRRVKTLCSACAAAGHRDRRYTPVEEQR